MKLTEKASDHTIFSYLEMLKNKKKLTMHNGSFGLVLIPQSRKYVYRIWADDPAYDAWAQIMIKNQNNLAVPEVFRKVKTITGKFLSGTIQLKVIKMEYLIDLPIGHTIEVVSNTTNSKKDISLSGLLSMIYRSSDDFERLFTISDDNVREQYSDISAIINKIKQLDSPIEPDFGVLGNVMQRQNGEYVLSDPIKMFVDDMVRLPAIRHKDNINDDIPLSVERIIRIKSDVARYQAIRKYDFSEEEIKQIMSDSTINGEVQWQLTQKYGQRASQYDHLKTDDISMDDLDEFMKQFEK
jgi:hypothetical protein